MTGQNKPIRPIQEFTPQEKVDVALDRKQQVFLPNIGGFIQVANKIPDWSPRNSYEQLAIYNNQSVYRLYWYDNVNQEWRYANGV